MNGTKMTDHDITSGPSRRCMGSLNQVAALEVVPCKSSSEHIAGSDRKDSWRRESGDACWLSTLCEHDRAEGSSLDDDSCGSRASENLFNRLAEIVDSGKVEYLT